MEIHQVQLPLGHRGGVGVDGAVHHVQPVVKVKEGVAQLMHLLGGVGGGVKIDVLRRTHQGLPDEIGDVGGRQVGVRILGQNLGHLANIGDVAQTDELLRRRLQKFMLHLNALQIAVDIALAVAAKPHGRLSVQQLIARLQMNHRPVVIVHGLGHVKIHPAQYVHHLNDGVQIDHCVAVHVKAGQLLHVAAQGIDAVAAVVFAAPVHAVQLSVVPLHVDDGIPGDADKIQLVAHRVQLAHHDGVGVAGAVVVAGQQDGVNAVLALGVKGAALVVLGLDPCGAGPGAGRRLGRLRRQGRRPLPEPVGPRCQSRRQHHSTQGDPGNL